MLQSSKNKVVVEISSPKEIITKKVLYNSKYASRIYLPANWEGKSVLVILK